ncbi:MAG: helix-turn-helix domain-containing protein [Gammaproteobacteria bacterium]
MLAADKNKGKFLISKGHAYSTDDIRTKEQFDFWNDVVCDEFIQLKCSRTQAKGFSGNIHGSEIAEMQISEVAADPHHVMRSKKQIANSTESEFLLSLQLEDIGVVNQDGRIAKLQPGDFALYDSTRPYELHFAKPFRQIVLQIPYDSLAERFVKPETITAHCISAQTGVGALTSQFIQSVASRLDTLSPQDARVVTEHVIELVALSMGSMSSLKEVNGQTIARTAMLQRLQQYIEINLRNPQLTPMLIASHHHISERYQRMLFASIGTTITRYILNRRLDLCKEALMDDALADYNVKQLAFDYGFNNAAHFSRKFKEKFGMSPKQCRSMSDRNNLLSL